MKQLLPVALSFLIVACAPPKPGTVGHQQRLAEEAREHFYAMKEKERIARGGAPRTQAEERAARVRLKPFAPAKPAPQETVYAAEKSAPAPAAKPTSAPRPFAHAKVKPTAPPGTRKHSLFGAAKPEPKQKSRPTPKLRAESNPKPSSGFWTRKAEPKRNDDTVYIFDTPAPARELRSKRYLAYKSSYAQALGKRPEDLSKKELEWVRTHHRD